MSENSDPNFLHIKAQLDCGTEIEITQPERYMNISFTPKQGTTVAEFADLKNGKLNVRVTTESLLGLYELLKLIVEPAPKKKTFLEEIFDIKL